MTTAQATEVPTLADLAREATERHNDNEGATEMMQDRLAALPEMREELLGEMERRACHQAVLTARQQTRATIKASCNPNPCPRGAEAIGAAADPVILEIADKWIIHEGPGKGKCLGDLYGAEMDSLIEIEEKTGEGHFENARFYRAIRKRTPDRAKVRNRSSQEVLIELLRAARKK